jgi:hypothetical protein
LLNDLESLWNNWATGQGQPGTLTTLQLVLTS